MLDTGTWVAVRRRRVVERFAVWGILLGAAVLIVGLLWGGSALMRTISDRNTAVMPPAETIIPAPTHAKTPIAVWNGLGADGVAAEAARQAMLNNYPITAVGDAPNESYEKTYVMYQSDDPAGPSAARELITQLNLKGAVPTPIEGVGAEQLAGARLLLIVADPLAH